MSVDGVGIDDSVSNELRNNNDEDNNGADDDDDDDDDDDSLWRFWSFLL